MTTYVRVNVSILALAVRYDVALNRGAVAEIVENAVTPVAAARRSALDVDVAVVTLLPPNPVYINATPGTRADAGDSRMLCLVTPSMSTQSPLVVLMR